MRELPVPGAVANGIDVRHRSAAVLVGGDPLSPVELNADLLEPEALDERPAADGDEHQVRLHGLALAEVHRELRPVVVDAGALLAQLQRDAAALELLRELLRGIRVLLRDQRVEHLDDGHLAAEAREDRRELAADDAAAENDEAPRYLLLCEEAGRVDAARRVEPRVGGRSGNEPVATTACLKETSSPPSTAIVFASRKRPAPLTHSTPFALNRDATPEVIWLTTPAFQAFEAAKSSRASPTWTPNFAKLSSASFSANAVCTHALVGISAHAETCAAKLRLLLDAGDPRAELRGADGCGVAPGASPENGDVDVHGSSLFDCFHHRW